MFVRLQGDPDTLRFAVLPFCHFEPGGSGAYAYSGTGHCVVPTWMRAALLSSRQVRQLGTVWCGHDRWMDYIMVV